MGMKVRGGQLWRARAGGGYTHLALGREGGVGALRVPLLQPALLHRLRLRLARRNDLLLAAVREGHDHLEGAPEAPGLACRLGAGVEAPKGVEGRGGGAEAPACTSSAPRARRPSCPAGEVRVG